jgi:acylphosphatase
MSPARSSRTSATLRVPVDDAADELLLHLEVRGQVQAGYRQWMARVAREFGVAGWVRNSDDPTLVEACLAGPAGPVAALASLAIRGPAQAQPIYVRCRHFQGDQPTGRFAGHR